MFGLGLSIAMVAAHWPAVNYDGDFSLRTSFLATIDNGPVIVRNVLRYHGDKPVKVLWHRQFSNIGVHLPAHPLAGHKLVAIVGRLEPEEVEMGSEDCLVEYECLHDWHVKSTLSGVRARIDCNVYGPGAVRSPPKRLASLGHSITLLTFPKSSATMSAFASNFVSAYRDLNISLPQRLNYSKWIDSLLDIEYLPLLLRLLDSSQSEEEIRTWINRIALTKCPKTVLSTLVVELLRRQDQSSSYAFLLWFSNRLPLPNADEILTLKKSQNAWIQSMASLGFPMAVDSKGVDDLCKLIEFSYVARSREQVLRLVKEADANSFVIRERATKELRELGEYAEATLVSVLRTELSEEVRVRLAKILMELRIDPHSEARRAIRCISTLESSGAEDFLKKLSSSGMNNQVPRLAAAAITEREKKRK